MAVLATGLALALLGGTLTPALASDSPGNGAQARVLGAKNLAPAADPASLAMTSSVSPSPLVVGETAVYTVTVLNTGTADAANVVTTLPFAPAGAVAIDSSVLPSGCAAAGQTVTCTETTIPAGGSATYTIPVTVLPSVSDGTYIELRGTATATGGATASAVLITQAFTQVDVEITKSGPATASPGGTITYTITVTNNGPSDAATVNFTDPTNGNLTTITSYPCGNTGLTVTCQVGTMTPGETRVFQLTVKVNDNVPAGTVITNCATVDTGTRPETNPDNNNSCTDTYVDPGTPVADVEVTKTGPATVDPGGTITYTVSVTNHGPDEAANVIVADPLAEPLITVQSLPAGCTEAGGSVTCDAGPLAVGESRLYTITVQVDPGVHGVVIPNCAQDYTSTQDPDLDNNQACVNTFVSLLPSGTSVIKVSKDGPAVVRPGGTMTYTVDVTNHGPDAADNVIITDPVDTTAVTVISLPANCALRGSDVVCVLGDLAVHQTETLTFTVVVAADAAPGSEITNCAAAGSHSTGVTQEPAQECVQTYVLPNQRALLAITKLAPDQVLPNGVFRYTVLVVNHGPDPATDVIIKDPIRNPVLVTITSLPSGCMAAGGSVTCQLGTLAAGGTRLLIAEVRAFPDLADGTVIKNCAAVYTTTSDPDLASSQSCVNTVVVKPFFPVTG